MEQFTISEAAVRKQLNVLLRVGFIREKTIKKEIGRPYHLYSLTDKGHRTFPNHEALPVELLHDLEVSQGKEVVYSLLETRKERIEKKMKKEIGHDQFKEQVCKMVAYQEEKGYMVDVKETTEGDFEIINYNCPIYNLVSNYKIVCEHEKNIYSDIFPRSFVQSHDCMTKGANHCYWTITNPENEE